MNKAPRHPWRWALGFACCAMLAYVWLWYSPDLMAIKQWASQASHHPAVIVSVMLIMAATLAIGLPGSIGLWLIAPFYPPLMATMMLTLSSVVGALGAYKIAARAGKRWNPGGLTLKVMHTLEQRSDLMTQTALRLLPGFPHSVINFAAGLRGISLKTFLLAAGLGLSVKWSVYSSAIYGALEAIEEENALQFDVVLPLIALALLLLIGAWFRRRIEAAQVNR
ncbi:VTT domain-containing protein [Halomonas sp. FME1]|uniref:VTT domain-containing protein n=1 Tax=Halomonas casei TaxID=2742613 RepID=A0ABR9F2A3_9GAMM|nr:MULTISPECIES: VTT domain-containing protein [Halomonas]MBE0400618.1 VTT domain-containing protein [Halomonas casei]